VAVVEVGAGAPRMGRSDPTVTCLSGDGRRSGEVLQHSQPPAGALPRCLGCRRCVLRQAPAVRRWAGRKAPRQVLRCQNALSPCHLQHVADRPIWPPRHASGRPSQLIDYAANCDRVPPRVAAPAAAAVVCPHCCLYFCSGCCCCERMSRPATCRDVGGCDAASCCSSSSSSCCRRFRHWRCCCCCCASGRAKRGPGPPRGGARARQSRRCPPDHRQQPHRCRCRRRCRQLYHAKTAPLWRLLGRPQMPAQSRPRWTAHQRPAVSHPSRHPLQRPCHGQRQQHLLRRPRLHAPTPSASRLLAPPPQVAHAELL
jgi:hypothetical protein